MDYTEDLWTDIISADGSHIIVCTCYHPPKPKYNTRDFIDKLVLNFEHLLAIHPDIVYIH